MKNSAVLAMIVVLEAAGNTSLSRGMRQVGAMGWPPAAPAAVAWVVAHIFSNPWVIVGVAFLLGYFFFYLTALSRLDLSYVLPVTASNYILTALLAWAFLGEGISASRWIGTSLICAGVVAVARSERSENRRLHELETVSPHAPS